MQDKPKVSLVEHLLGEQLEPWVQTHRADGRSWQWIAYKIAEKTRGEVTVTAEYLRQLFGQVAA
jgi:hypothetical protein